MWSQARSGQDINPNTNHLPRTPPGWVRAAAPLRPPRSSRSPPMADPRGVNPGLPQAPQGSAPPTAHLTSHSSESSSATPGWKRFISPPPPPFPPPPAAAAGWPLRLRRARALPAAPSSTAGELRAAALTAGSQAARGGSGEEPAPGAEGRGGVERRRGGEGGGEAPQQGGGELTRRSPQRQRRWPEPSEARPGRGGRQGVPGGRHKEAGRRRR